MTHNQKENLVETCRALQRQLETDPDFLSKDITGNSSYCYIYDPEPKQQSSWWKTPLSSNQIKHQNSADLLFWCQGVVHSVSPRSDCQSIPIFENSKKCSSKKARFVADSRLVIPKRQCTCKTSLFNSFYLKMWWFCCPTHITSLNWLRATFFANWQYWVG